ncbi:helix-turn-helix transcriptional regulator [Streptomyces sp. NPDC006393]|uniref:helix-turn-helix transcriptional regulator n=1 Tax=Streptomyces sp. NPDC006393 TaxID=3156763 RepID=UPI0034099CBA
MTTQSDIRAFLASRRARITPRQAGLPAYGGNRRVPGLRREEVALLAGVSIDYYVRLERGHLAGASEEVLDAVANALQLDDAERAHLHDLARAAARRPVRRTRRVHGPLPDSVLRVLRSMTDSPAFIRNGRLDILATNTLGRALYDPLFPDGTAQTVNIARSQFLVPGGRDFFPDWEESVNTTVSLLRTEAGRAPHDTELTGLIGELVTRSEEFRVAWARHNVRLHHTGRKSFRHPAVGVLTLDFDAMELPARPGLTLTAYSAAPGTPDHDALRLLAAWAATEGTRPTGSPAASGPRDRPAAGPRGRGK